MANDGPITLGGASSLTLSSTWANGPTGSITATGGSTVNFAAGGRNDGAITIDHSTIVFPSSGLMVNAGTLNLIGATVSAPAGLFINDSTLVGSGTINGDLSLDSDPSDLVFNIGGSTPGAGYDTLTVNGNMLLAGNLDLYLTNGYQNLISPGDEFTVLNVTGSHTLTGAFLNVSDGGRLTTADGLGSFQVNYESGAFGTSVVLSNFALVPEPTSLALVLAAATLLVRRHRRL
jgi:hypothetical protein